MFALKDSLAIVTGAGRGNGYFIASALHNAGASVIGIDIKFPKINKNIAQICGDVRSEIFLDEILYLVQTKRFKHLVIVNNAGVTFPIEGKYPTDKWDETLEINLKAPFLIIEKFTGEFEKIKSGSIINITSLAAEKAFPNNPAYIASKGGLKMLSKFYAKSLGHLGVRVNNIGPGYIHTDMTDKSFENVKTRKERQLHTMLNRWGKPDDLVGACIFLASQSSSYITGQDIYIDGGWLANGLISFDN